METIMIITLSVLVIVLSIKLHLANKEKQETKLMYGHTIHILLKQIYDERGQHMAMYEVEAEGRKE